MGPVRRLEPWLENGLLWGCFGAPRKTKPHKSVQHELSAASSMKCMQYENHNNTIVTRLKAYCVHVYVSLQTKRCRRERYTCQRQCRAETQAQDSTRCTPRCQTWAQILDPLATKASGWVCIHNNKAPQTTSHNIILQSSSSQFPCASQKLQRLWSDQELLVSVVSA